MRCAGLVMAVVAISCGASSGTWRGGPAESSAPDAPAPEVLVIEQREGERETGSGELAAGGTPFPLEHTDVHARVSGFVAETEVVQRFRNPLTRPIEAVYTFPLPSSGAVNGFVMEVGERRIVGVVKPREEARAIYAEAVAAGFVASLLIQERPNVFTERVANIAPGADVQVRVTYFETLKYDDGRFEYVFPMVVGPRYRGIAPPIRRTGQDVDLTLDLDAGLPIRGFRSVAHEVDIQKRDARRWTIGLRGEVPNRDFVAEWRVAGHDAEFGVVSDRRGFFALLAAPPEAPDDERIVPRELTFILDVSGSMNGLPLEMATAIVRRTLGRLRPRDRFNIVTFASDSDQLWNGPRRATEEAIDEARDFMDGLDGGGGTEMLPGLRRALGAEHDDDCLQMYVFLTDGLVGNDNEILEAVKRAKEARFFAFGPGSSVNRFLLGGIAEHGRGATLYANPRDERFADAVVGRFMEMIDAPVLVDVSIDWNGLPVSDVHPKRLPDLFVGQTLSVVGKFSEPAEGTIYVEGRLGRRRVRLPVEACFGDARNPALATLWARHKIHETKSRDEIIKTAIKYRLATAWTSFVAVDESEAVTEGDPLPVRQPVERPEGQNP